MQTAGVTQLGGPITLVELPGPGRPGPGEVLLDVRAGGVGNWDEFVRTGGWDTGVRPPMALGVEAAGRVAAVGDGVQAVAPGDAVTTPSRPLRGQGSWAEQHLAAAEHVALIPPGVSWDAAAALPVPVLTPDQALAALHVQPGPAVRVNRAGGLAGGLVERPAAPRGGRVIATVGPGSAVRVRAQFAATVLDYHDPDW